MSTLLFAKTLKETFEFIQEYRPDVVSNDEGYYEVNFVSSIVGGNTEVLIHVPTDLTKITDGLSAIRLTEEIGDIAMIDMVEIISQRELKRRQWILDSSYKDGKLSDLPHIHADTSDLAITGIGRKVRRLALDIML